MNEMYGNNNVGNMNNFMAPQSLVRITNLLLIPTRYNYNDVYRRSYNLNINDQSLTKLENMFDRHGIRQNNTVNEMAVATELPNIMTYNTLPTGKSNIVNGWGTKRFRFIMTTESELNGTTIVSYIQGYTEYYDVSLSGLLDPNMKYYINSIVNITRIIDPVSGGVIVRPQNSFNVIIDHDGNSRVESTYNDPYSLPFENNSIMPQNNVDLKLIRPTDIADSIKNKSLYEDDNVMVHNHAGDVDGSSAIVSNRRNNDPISHFTSTINSFITAKSTAANSYEQSDILKTAAIQSAESQIINTPFISALYSVTGIPEPYSFTERELDMIDPNVKAYIPDQNTRLANVDDSTFLDTMYTEDLYKQNIETIIAVTVGESINSAIIENMLTKIAFSTTNISGLPTTIIDDFNSFIEGVDMIPYVNKIKAKIDNILMPEISQNGLILIDLHVVANLLGDTTIEISVNNNPPIVYRLPTFADSLYTPVATDEVSKNLITNDFSTVMDMSYDLNANDQTYV